VEAVGQRLAAGLDDVLGRAEVGRADVELQDLLALRLERGHAVHDLERGLRAQARNGRGELQAGFQMGSFHAPRGVRGRAFHSTRRAGSAPPRPGERHAIGHAALFIAARADAARLVLRRNQRDSNPSLAGVALTAIAAAQENRWITVTDAAAPVPGMSVVHVGPSAPRRKTSSACRRSSNCPGWPVTIAANANFAPWRTGVVTDLDRDGRNEILVASTNGRLYGFRPDGTALPGFPIVLTGMAQVRAVGRGPGGRRRPRDRAVHARADERRAAVRARPHGRRAARIPDQREQPEPRGLADAGRPRRRRQLEILVPERAYPIGYLHVFERDGTQWGGAWPVALDHVPTGSPAVADVDGDGRSRSPTTATTACTCCAGTARRCRAGRSRCRTRT
jgi:hypothetical protein